MKAIVLALLLANLLFLAWTQWLAPIDAPASPAPASTGVPTLQLAKESKPAGSAPAQERAENPAPPAQAADEVAGNVTGREAAVQPDPELLTGITRCLSIGSFRTLPEATQASATLRSAGYEPRTRVAEGDVWAGLWVSLQGMASRTEAQRAMTVLRERGVSDAYVMPAAGGRSEISLGIFSDPVRAQRRAEEVRAMGFTPTVADRTRRGPVYWIDVDLKPADGFIDPADFQGESGRIVRLEVQACPAADEPG